MEIKDLAFLYQSLHAPGKSWKVIEFKLSHESYGKAWNIMSVMESHGIQENTSCLFSYGCTFLK